MLRVPAIWGRVEARVHESKHLARRFADEC
jgi:hypothetical protein